MKIAICTDTKEFQENKILDKNWAEKFPGAAWVPVFANLTKRGGIDVVTGDIALQKVLSGIWKAEEALVIQELDGVDGQKLVELGAIPAILTGFEPPLYAYKFYDGLSAIAPKFHYRVLYSGAFETFKVKGGFNYPLHFPSYHVDNIAKPEKWNNRDFLIMVAANKYYDLPIPVSFNPKNYLNWILSKFARLLSPTGLLTLKNELLTKRLEAIEYFSLEGKIKLFGKNWDSLNNLPNHWQKRLKKILPSLNPKPIANKIKTIAKFKFAICFENVAYPGCITEKILDCFVAGVIPIYLGAPDIEKHIPSQSFINMGSFKSFRDLEKFLEKINQKDAEKIITAGRNFLQSSEGKLYSYEGVAKFITKLIFEMI